MESNIKVDTLLPQKTQASVATDTAPPRMTETVVVGKTRTLEPHLSWKFILLLILSFSLGCILAGGATYFVLDKDYENKLDELKLENAINRGGSSGCGCGSPDCGDNNGDEEDCNCGGSSGVGSPGCGCGSPDCGGDKTGESVAPDGGAEKCVLADGYNIKFAPVCTSGADACAELAPVCTDKSVAASAPTFVWRRFVKSAAPGESVVPDGKSVAPDSNKSGEDAGNKSVAPGNTRQNCGC